MSFFRFRLRQICAKDFVLLQIVLQKTEILESRKDRIRSDYGSYQKLILQVHKDHKKAIV